MQSTPKALPPRRPAATGRLLFGLALPLLVLLAPDARAAIQSWDDGAAIHLSNLEPAQAAATLTDDSLDDAGPLVSVAPGSAHAAAPGASGAGTSDGQGPDISRLVAHDPRTAERLARFAPLVSSAARQHGVDAALLQAVVAIESAYNPVARSRKGAVGLMQVMPGTAARYGISDLDNPLENLRAGCLYLKDLLSLFHQNVELAVAAYNAGENAVVHHGNRIPPYAETQRYVPQVLEIYRNLLR
jgi:soluble lytic murein transglycosylase-like protein